MTPKRTVFIVGAGASSEIGLPVGAELKENIISLLHVNYLSANSNSERLINKSDKLINKTLEDQGLYKNQQSIREIESLRNKICDGLRLAVSIDNYLDVHNDDKNILLCGKLAIVRSILMAEQNSKIFFQDDNSQFSVEDINKTWYVSFFQKLVENCKFSNLDSRLKLITFIVFNYDRCIEHFLYHAIQIYYQGVKAEEVAALLNENLNIYHPYGTVGSLPWANGENQISYGATIDSHTLFRLSKDIKTFTESEELLDQPNNSIDEIRSSILNSERIIFLGFSFLIQNMDLIYPQKTNDKPSTPIYATSFGMSHDDYRSIKSELYQRFGTDPDNQKIVAFECYRFFKEFNRTLTFIHKY